MLVNDPPYYIGDSDPESLGLLNEEVHLRLGEDD